MIGKVVPLTPIFKGSLQFEFCSFYLKMTCSLADSSFIFMYLVDDTTNEYLTTLCTAIRFINHPQKYYEKVLRNATDRPGTDENAVTGVIVIRAKVDLKEIEDLYYKRNNETLDHAVAKDTSGDYKDILLTLLKKED